MLITLLQTFITLAVMLTAGNLTYNFITYSKRFYKPLYASRWGLALTLAGLAGWLVCWCWGWCW